MDSFLAEITGYDREDYKCADPCPLCGSPLKGGKRDTGIFTQVIIKCSKCNFDKIFPPKQKSVELAPPEAVPEGGQVLGELPKLVKAPLEESLSFPPESPEISRKSLRECPVCHSSFTPETEYQYFCSEEHRLVVRAKHPNTGRPRTGEARQCKRCGKDIYIRAYRVKKGMGYYCWQCSKKVQATSFRCSIKGLVVYGADYTTEEMAERTMAILAKHLKRDPVATVGELLPAAQTFTADELIEAAFTMQVEETLKFCPDFEQIGRDTWKLRGN